MAIVRSLTTHLEVLPAILLVLLRECGVAEPVLLVVDVREVLDDRSALQYGQWLG